MTATLKAFSALLCYPSQALRDAIGEIRAVIQREEMIAPQIQTELNAFCDTLEQSDLIDLQEHYVALFDKTRRLSLHLFEHVHGESRDRGQALVDLAMMYERSGLAIAIHELPDYLPLFLEYLSTRPFAEAQPLLADTLPILAALEERLKAQNTGYAAVLRAIRSVAGDRSITAAAAVDAAGDDLSQLDTDWEEPPVLFGPETARCGSATATSLPIPTVPHRARRS